MNSVSYPNQSRNYCIFDNAKIQLIAEKKEKALPEIKSSLINAKNDDEILENLYALNILLDNGVSPQKVGELYPELSKYNETNSPEIQTFLAGVYRKTKIPDAFGPLIKMLIRDSINPPRNKYFDPTEEIGGAILDYIA